MGYKTILTVVTDEALAQSTIDHAAAVAAAWDAHLDVLCFGVDRTQTGYYYAGANAMIVGNYLTTTGRPVEADLAMIRNLGLVPDSVGTP